MLDWVVVTNYGFAVAGLTVAVLGFLMSLYAPHLQVWDRNYFKLFFLVLAAYVSSNLVGTLSVSMLDARFTPLSQACVFCESLFSSALMPLVTIYLLRCAGELSKRSALLRCVAALWALYLALLILTQYTRYIYYFTPDNVYHRGPLYPVLLVPPVLIMCMNLVAFIRRRDRLTRRRQVAFAIVLVLPLTCMLLQMYSYGLLMIVIGTSLASFGLFCFILSDQVQATMAREEEAARQHSALMALQMRPHFIYNVLTSIYYLCAQDPARAQQATLDFTNYLRANFAAVASREPVPFTEELNHTRAYLAVESIRFGDRLQISLDCPHTAFRLPPLTLQPLAENAVKHGVDPELPPLEVHVTTRHEDGASVVTVEDTGPGFDLASTPGTGASALTNLTERLETAGIGFSVLPREGGGTIATIIVPDEEK